MDNTVEIIDYLGYSIKIVQDNDSQSPQHWENDDMFLVYDHRQFNIEVSGYEPDKIYQYLEDCHERLDNHEYDDYFIFPVYAYIHSGVVLSLGNDSYPFNDKWDTSMKGFILINKTEMDFDLNRNHKEEWKDKTDEELARIFAEGLIESWNQYLSGEVYGFEIYKKVKYYKISEENFNKVSMNQLSNIDYIRFIENAESFIESQEIDSCYGFYGDYKKSGCLDEAKDIIETLIKENEISKNTK